MKSLLTYFFYQAKKSWIMFASMLILPTCIPYIIYGIMSAFMNKPDDLSSSAVSIPMLPQLDRISYEGDLQNFVYFAYSPETDYAKLVLNTLLQRNNLTEKVRVKSFANQDEMDHYVNIKNIIPFVREKFENNTLFNSIVCQDMKKALKIENCSLDLNKSMNDTLKTVYGLVQSDFEDYEQNPEKYSDEFLFGINFLVDGENISNIKNVTYEFIYNSTLLDATISKFPDPLSVEFGNLRNLPFWTGYTFTLQKQLDEITVKKLTNLDYEVNFGRLDELINTNTPILMFFETTVMMAFGVLFIFVVLIGNQNRGTVHIILRRLGVREWQFWLCNTFYIFIPTWICLFIMGTIWYFTGIAIFLPVTYGFVVFQMTCLAVVYSAFTMLISALMGNSQSASVICACLCAFFLIIMPSMFHQMIFLGRSFFDPSLVPQWAIWFVQVILPPLQTVGIVDSMTSLLTDRNLAINRYNWEIYQDTVGLEYIFTDYNNYTTIPHLCSKGSSKNGIKGFEICMYYQPSYGYVTLLNILEGVVLWLFSLLIFLLKTESGYRGIKIQDILSPFVWKRINITQKSQIFVKNLQISFKIKQKCKKCQQQNVTTFQQFSKNKEIVLKNINYSLGAGQISALVAESSSGKSTTLKFLAGELHPTHIQSKIKTVLDNDNLALNHNYLLNEANLSEISSFFNSIDGQQYKIFEDFDLSNSANAVAIKPYIGFCPQDCSNVWMDMSCYDNVKFSLLLRTENQNRQISEQQLNQEVIAVLKSLDLDERDVLKRKAKQLSGGMLRRLGLCNALVGNPHILLLDEVSAGVDPVLKRMIWSCMKKLSDEVSVVLTTHDMGEIAEMAQRVTIIDKGFSIVTDTSPFDLRVKDNGYSIKYYHNKPICNFIVASSIQQMLVDFIHTDKGNILIDTVSPHGIQFSIKQGVSSNNLLPVCQLLEQIKNKFGFQDYILNKSKLDDIYIDLIGYKRITEFEQNNVENKEIIKATNIKNQYFHRFSTLLKVFFYRDFHVQIPLIFWICLTCVILAVLTFWFKYLMEDLFAIINREYLSAFRYSDVAKDCLQACKMYYITDEIKSRNPIQFCFDERPYKLFGKQNLDEITGQVGQCSYYSTYLGIDVQQPHYIAIGDNKYQFKQGYQSVGFGGKVQKITPENYSFKAKVDIVSQENSTIILNNEVDYYNKDNLLLNIKPSYLAYSNHGKLVHLQCMIDCKKYNNQFNTCGEDFNFEQCSQTCTNLSYIDDTSYLVTMPNFNEVGNYQNFMEIYREYVHYNWEMSRSQEKYYSTRQKLLRAEQMSKRLMLGYVSFDENNYTNNRNVLNGSLKVNYTTFLPNRGTTGGAYSQNIFWYDDLDNASYLCDGKWSNKTKSSSYYIVGQHSIHGVQVKDGIFGQSLPDKDSVVLFDIVNQPLTQLVGGLLRQAKGDSSITYSIVSRQMPKFVSPDTQQVSSVSQEDMLNSLCNMQLTVTGLLPMMYAGMQMGYEFEIKIPRLLKLHFTSFSSWIIASFIYYSIITFLPMLTNIICMMILVPDTFFGSSYSALNVFYFIIECFEGIPTGILLAILTRKGKNAAMLSFFILLFALMFSVLSFGNETFTYIVMLFLPAYSQYFEIFLNGMKAKPNWGIFFTGLAISLLYIGIIFIVVNFDYLKLYFRTKFGQTQKISKPQNIASDEQAELIGEFFRNKNDLVEQHQNCEMLIRNIDMTYNTGTHALQGINLEIPSKQVFGLLGSNGSGKSTLMHCLSGIYSPQKGTATLLKKGIDLLQTQEVSQYFSIVPQHDIYWANLTILEHIQMIQNINALPQRVSTEFLLETLQLTEHKDKVVDKLSGGMKRRLSIALAMTTMPDILALDEPSTGLGLTTKRFVHQAILRVLNQDSTLVLTSHDMEEVEALVDYCCIMYKGVVLRVGTIGELRQSCKVQFELSLRLIDEGERKLVSQILAEQDILDIRYNEMTDIYVFQIGRGGNILQILQKLDQSGLIDRPWILEAVLMEHVFMSIVSQVENNKKINE